MTEVKTEKNARPLTKAGMGISEGLPLEVSKGGIDELRADIQRLMDIEAIKQLKHAYFRCSSSPGQLPTPGPLQIRTRRLVG